MSVPAARRIVVGLDGSVESVAALRWACREASLRGAEVHAVHVREEHRHSLASYAVPALSAADDGSSKLGDLVHMVQADQAPRVEPRAGARGENCVETRGETHVDVRVEEVDGLAARVLLDRCVGADMLVLGTSGDVPGGLRSAGPVIRACLRRAACPVVVISAAQDPMQRVESAARSADSRVKVPAGV